jgi:O-antigen/teichoic acid export membrane protein
MGGIGFGTSAALLAWGSQAEFAVYALVLALIQFSQSIQNAAVISPLLANAPRIPGSVRPGFIARLVRIGSLAAVVFGLLVGAMVYGGVSEIPPGSIALALGTVAGLVGLWAREQRRSIQFLHLDSWNVLRGDVAYLILLVVALGGSWALVHRLTAGSVFLAFGVAGLLTGTLSWRRKAEESVAGTETVRDVLRRQMGWTVPSVVVSWAYSNAYVYIVAAFAGLNSLAELNAARLIAVPASLLQVAWNRLYLPSAGTDLASGRHASAFRGARNGAFTVAAGTVLYGAVVLLAMTLPPLSHIPRLAGISVPTVLLWLAYFLASGVRGIATNLNMAQTAFRRLFLMGVIGALVGVACMVALGEGFGASGIVIAMIAGETFLAAALWLRAARTARPGGAA